MIGEHYWKVLLKHWQVIVICAVLAELGVLLGSHLLPSAQAQYAAYARIEFDSVATLNDVTLAQVATSPAVLNAVTPHYPGLTTSTLSREVTVTQESSTPVLRVTVTDTNPTRAAALANDVAAAVVIAEPERLSETLHQQYAPAQQQIQSQISSLQDQIAGIEAKLQQLQPGGSDAGQYTSLQEQLAGLQQQNALLQYSLSQIQVVQVEKLIPPTLLQQAIPSSSHSSLRAELMTYGSGLLFGLIVGIALLLLRDRYDQRIRGAASVGELLEWPALATFTRPGARSVEAHETESGVASDQSAAQTLETNLAMLGIDHTVRSLVVTSADDEEDASEAVAVMARALAGNGKDVIVVDAHLGRPTQNNRFGIQSNKGLTDAALAAKVRGPGNVQLDQFLFAPAHPTIDNVRVMTTGMRPPNPEQFLQSPMIGEVISGLAALGPDLILVDAPSVLSAPDTYALAAHTDGVLVIVNSARARRDTLVRMKERLVEAHVNVVGYVSFNNDARDVTVDQPVENYAEQRV